MRIRAGKVFAGLAIMSCFGAVGCNSAAEPRRASVPVGEKVAVHYLADGVTETPSTRPTVEPMAVAPSTRPAEGTVGVTSPDSTGAGGSPVALPETTVVGRRTYGVERAFTATKTDLPLIETPSAISVVPQALLEDRGTRRLEDALSNVSGVTPGGYYSDWDYYRIRGFDGAFNTYWDGLRGDYGKNVEVYGIERVEVLKGSASLLYGQNPPGGIVNIISKRPRPEPFAEVMASVGSYDFYEAGVDVGTPLNNEGTVYARLTGLYRFQESFTDYIEKQRGYIAPAFTWEINERTTLTVLTSFVYDNDQLGFPLPASGTVLPNPTGQEIPRDRYLGEPGSNMVDQWRAKVGYEFRHEFNDTFSLRQNASYSRLWQDWNNILYSSSLDADGRTLYRYPYSTREGLNRVAVDTALESRFNTGTIRHTLVGGFDFYYTNSNSRTEQINYADFPGSYTPIDIFDPVYTDSYPLPTISSLSRTSSNSYGIYVFDEIKVTDQITVVLGGRFDVSNADNSGSKNSDSAFSPRAGVSYEFIPGLAVYGSYSESFKPQTLTDEDGNVLDPERGQTIEGGFKWQSADNRLSGMASVYQITRKDVGTSDPTTPDQFDSTASGEQRARGFELESQWQFAPGWAFTGAYTYTDARITDDNTLPEGARLQGVPYHAISSWVTYSFPTGPLKGFGLGVGGRYYSEQVGDATYSNPFELPSYLVMDAAAWYRDPDGKYSVQLNVNNFLDKEYFVGSYSDLYVLPGEPITFRLSASLYW